MLTVLEIAPERKGWAAAIIRTCAFQGMLRVPLGGWNAQSNTGKCSAFKSAAPSMVSSFSMWRTIDSISASLYPNVASAGGTVWLTIFSIPPPANCLYLTRAMSGSMPVVSQSIMKLIVPVGASTVAWALRKPCRRPPTSTSSQISRAADFKYSGAPLIFSTCSQCISITWSMGSRFSSKASKGPTAAASSLLARQAAPCNSAVTAPHRPRASSES